MGHTLLLDCSTPAAVVALAGPDALAPEADELLAAGANQASAWLDSAARRLLRQAGIGGPDVARVVCGWGPGTFTGTRVAVAYALGLVSGRAAELWAVSTLASLAAGLGEQAGGRRLAVIDARRAEVYVRGYRFEGGAAEPLAAPALVPVDKLASVADELGVELVTGTLDRARTGLPPDRYVPVTGPSARGIWLAMTSGLAVRVDPGAVEIDYLRRTYAELGINRPKQRPFAVAAERPPQR